SSRTRRRSRLSARADLSRGLRGNREVPPAKRPRPRRRPGRPRPRPSRTSSSPRPLRPLLALVPALAAGASSSWAVHAPLPFPRAAAGAAALGGTMYVVGGVGPTGLARNTLAWDGRRWRALPGPTPREHLSVAAAGGRVYAIGGRTAGYDTNLAIVESWR